jgi:hypothetical protein
MNDFTESYEWYRALGGIINEPDYISIIFRAKTISEQDHIRIAQLKTIAEFSGISESALPAAYPLFEIMRTDRKPHDVKYHHCQMCDQRLFAEALRMLGDEVSLAKLIATYPHIEFS